MSRLLGRVAVVTGAGRGLGRAHALRLAHEGASVVVNDTGGALDGTGQSEGPASSVAEEIRDAGGQAVASTHDISDWTGALELINLALSTFGHLNVLVNNAGILRDRTLANLEESEWDSVIRVHLKGHAAPTRHAMAYWRDMAKAGVDLKPSVIHTSSVAAFAGNVGQANYCAAKAAVLGLSRVVSLEGARYGVRSNVIAPSAQTRITSAMGGADQALPDDFLDPAGVSPLVAWLASPNCPSDSQVFQIVGDHLAVYSMPVPVHQVRSATGRWTLEELDEILPMLMVTPPQVLDLLPQTQT